MDAKIKLTIIKKLTNAIQKIAKVDLSDFYDFIQDMFYTYNNSIANLKIGQIVSRASKHDKDYPFGFVINNTKAYEVDVCFCDSKKPDNIETYRIDGRLIRQTENGRILTVADMDVDEFVKFVGVQLKEYKNLNKRAKITNREFFELKKEIKELRNAVFELKNKAKEEEEAEKIQKEIIRSFSSIRRPQVRYNNRLTDAII